MALFPPHWKAGRLGLRIRRHHGGTMKTIPSLAILALFAIPVTAQTRGSVVQKAPQLTEAKCEADTEKWFAELDIDALHRLSHKTLFDRQGELSDCRGGIIPLPSAFPKKGEDAAGSAIRYGLELEQWSNSMKLSWLYAAEAAYRATLYINTYGLADNYQVFEDGLVASGR